jgi:hypothetical protein
MSPDFASFQHVLKVAMDLHGTIMTRDDLYVRPSSGTHAMAARLKAGTRALSAYLRRILILMALAMEADLVPGPRPDDRKRANKLKLRVKRPHLRIYPDHFHPRMDVLYKLQAKAKLVRAPFDYDAARPRVQIDLGPLFTQLDHLRALIQSPLAKAKSLAFSLARTRHGIMLPPPDKPRLLRQWGTEAPALFAAMGAGIVAKSRTRPPPLPPPRRGSRPSITRL